MAQLNKVYGIKLTPEYMRRHFNTDLPLELGRDNIRASSSADSYCDMAYNACLDWAVRNDVRMREEQDIIDFLDTPYKKTKFIYAQGLCLAAWLENGRGGVIQRDDGEWLKDMPIAAIKVLRSNVGFNKTNWLY